MPKLDYTIKSQSSVVTDSWLISPLRGRLPYFEKQVSGYEAQRTPVSVQVTHSKPPSLILAMADSRKGTAEPYGSRSTTSNVLPVDLRLYKAALKG